MAAGAWVFPLTIVAFFVFLVGYVASNPAIPAEGSSRLRVEPGTVVDLEYVQYYGDEAYAARTSLADLRESGGLKASPFGVILTRSISLDIPQDASAADPIIKALLGRRAGDTVSTEPIVVADWEETRTVSRVMTTFPATETLADGENFSTARGNVAFDLDQALRAWSQETGGPVEVGDQVNCEPGAPWRCEITVLDRNAGTVTYRRALGAGRTIPPEPILRFWPQTPVPTSQIEPVLQGDEIALVWNVKPGDEFIIAQAAGDWDAGAYQVDSVDGLNAGVRYLAGADVLAHLVGEPVWFELTITGVEANDDERQA